MLQDQPEEIRAGQRSTFDPLRLGVLITEAHQAVLAGDDVLFADDAPVKIAPEVDQRQFAAADRFAVHHPLGRIASGQ